MEPWYKTVNPRKEVREGRSFNPDEFAIALEQVVAGTAPLDYRDPEQFFSRTCFTRALREHAGMVLRRLAGKTENTAPVLTLITQFGGGKTHTLTALYHLAVSGDKVEGLPGVSNLLKEAGLDRPPRTKVAVFVGNAWDPRDGRETPWIDIARQLAGDKGVEALGKSAKAIPPGTEAIGKLFDAAGGSALILVDETLNFINRHRQFADHFHAFIQNLTVAATGTTRSAAMISLPRSQVEMTEWDLQWQEKITKVVRRVARDLIVNDEAEISQVVCRRLFEDSGSDRIRRRIAKTYADWCFERRAQLPPEWMAVDTASTEAKAREFLCSRFEACYPFHPATLSVFQRKWQVLPQYQQTRGTLAMFAQWISLAYREGYQNARREPLITLGSAPLGVPEFRGIILGQLGDTRLAASIEADISGAQSHAKALDADCKGALRDIHSRVGATILFESSGGQAEKLAHLPELRFALGEPELDTTSIDNAAFALDAKAFFIRKAGSDGFQIRHQPTLKKVVNDRRASLDDETEVKPAMLKIVKEEFTRGASVPIVFFPNESADIPDSPKLTVVLMEPSLEWGRNGQIRGQIAEWTKLRGKSQRLYPGALLWCVKKTGRDLKEKTEVWLAWQQVAREIGEGILGKDFDRSDKAEIHAKVKEAEDTAKEEVWAGYSFLLLADNAESDGLKIINLGSGHSSSIETLCGRIIGALKSESLLNEGIGANYINRNWPPALKESGEWPLASLRQSFLNGSLTRLIDPDSILKRKIVEFVANGDLGLASLRHADGTYDGVWYREHVSMDEVEFTSDVFLLTKAKAEAVKNGANPVVSPHPAAPSPEPPTPEPTPTKPSASQTKTIRLTGSIPPETWNRVGTKLIAKLRSGGDLKIGVEMSVTLDSESAANVISDLKYILQELGLDGQICAEEEE